MSMPDEEDQAEHNRRGIEDKKNGHRPERGTARRIGYVPVPCLVNSLPDEVNVSYLQFRHADP